MLTKPGHILTGETHGDAARVRISGRSAFAYIPRVEFYTKAFFVALAGFVGYLLLQVLQPFAGSMAWAIFLAFILYPSHRWLTRNLGGRNGF